MDYIHYNDKWINHNSIYVASNRATVYIHNYWLQDQEMEPGCAKYHRKHAHVTREMLFEAL
jgi:hypothetical protein